MTLHGIGIDVVAVPRIRALLRRYGDRFVDRWFDGDELGAAGPEPAATLAEYLAIKEAVWKALGLEGRGPVPWKQIVVRSPAGDGWRIQLLGDLAAHPGLRRLGPIATTVTRDGDLVVAVALVESGPPG